MSPAVLVIVEVPLAVAVGVDPTTINMKRYYKMLPFSLLYFTLDTHPNGTKALFLYILPDLFVARDVVVFEVEIPTVITRVIVSTSVGTQ